MPARANFRKDATAAINSEIAKAPLYTKRPPAPGEKRVQRFFEEMGHFSKVLGTASRMRESQGAMHSMCSYAIDLKKEYGADLLSGGKEPAVEMANALAHGSLLAGMAVRADILLLAKHAKADYAKRAKAIKRKSTAMEIGLGIVAAAACILLGYELWHAIASSGGSNYRVAANVLSPAVALLAFGLLCIGISKLEEKMAAAVGSKRLHEMGLRLAAAAWKQVERMAGRAAIS